MLRDRRIVLGVTGGIAAYKAAELLRELVRRGAKVRVVMTDHACKFVTPLTFETLSENPVATDLFWAPGDFGIAHIALAEFAQLVVIAPATANIIGKMAAGLADDLLTTVLLATDAPVLICPAMNAKMYANAIVKENLARLVSRGHMILEPGYGELACRVEGQGRLAEPLEIAEEIESILTPKNLQGEHILVTAGPTQEPFDPVRFISNYSSGKMGYALAVMARRRGAEVTLVSGPTALPAPRGVVFVPVRTAVEMRDAVLANLEQATVVVKAAAVADYRPAVCEPVKIKKKEGSLTIHLERNPDIISEIADRKGDRIVVGFSMESDHLLEHARTKLFEKGMDFIVANDVTEPGAGFRGDTNVIRILDREGGVEVFPLMDKMDVAGVILDRVRKMRDGGRIRDGR
ncbi:MAG: bifunctional phosphopantothenoylcysteine decarboxylase/phosphopantothenate--cysteine ligase CoaBC [Syntrophobacterales bacterium CG_4_8_14_3_um_filter_58_8]|nr:MAG: bifunctional phosphopantothenoylcysteine decarboxylase/phosphopantothenate--cysteine ligase CoaBC [Syntrophobacterales bacterium CG03_land_8_20_14_0_80_58_14]PJC72238.1 MAG: bifunctional phosphopantothenoylcysteine decarboxylase/phosphopantothenate--cysteine ligase CoaBC [Syntrophobacterales bacterium CG_4_8_14_3_um_filter_58_8]